MHSQLQYVQQLSFLCSQALNFLTNNLLLLWNESHCFTIPNTKVIRQIPFDSFHILQVPQQQKNRKSRASFKSIHWVVEVGTHGRQTKMLTQ